MPCSIVNDRIGLHLESTTNDFALFIGDRKEEGAQAVWRSALQNPDLSQHELSAMLRRNKKKRQPAFRMDKLLADSRELLANN